MSGNDIASLASKRIEDDGNPVRDFHTKADDSGQTALTSHRSVKEQRVTFDLVLRELRAHNFAVLSTVDEDGTPDSAGVNYGVSTPGGALALYVMTRRQLKKARNIARNPHVALVVTALWWLHPLQVSSVLYVVQRMALLGAIAQLAALLVYVHARPLPTERAATARALLFVAFPIPDAIPCASWHAEHDAYRRFAEAGLPATCSP